jgi:hypothetical protein
VIGLHEDLPHPVPPQAFMTWKENWVFPGVDTAQRVALLFHVSLRPTLGEGIFTAKFNLDGWEHRWVGRVPVPADLAGFHPVVGDRLRLEVVEPLRRFRLVYASPELDADVTFTARFAPWDFEDGVKTPGPSTMGELGRTVFPFHHYEQALDLSGTLTVKEGPRTGQLEVRGWGNRDHSWGFRDDHSFLEHHWLCANFDDAYVQGTVMHETSYPFPKFGGFVSTEAGNVGVAHVDRHQAYWLAANEPFPALDRDVTYRLTAADGRRLTVTAHLEQPYGRLFLNFRSSDRARAYQDQQVMCDFTCAETGQRGAGVLEIGKRLVGPGVADRI